MLVIVMGILSSGRYMLQAASVHVARYAVYIGGDLSTMTGLLKNKALNELNGWVKEGVLDTIGSGSHKIYVRVNTMKD